MEPKLLPCANCGKPKVLMTGDYCLACSIQWEPDESNYIVVKPSTLEYAAKHSGISREYLNAKQEQAFEKFQVYVIYFHEGEWKEITISDRFAVPTVMKNLLKP